MKTYYIFIRRTCLMDLQGFDTRAQPRDSSKSYSRINRIDFPVAQLYISLINAFLNTFRK